MSFKDSIDTLIIRGNDITKVPHKKRRTRIELYSMGLKAKIDNCNFALANVESLCSKNTTATVTEDRFEGFELIDQIGFYVDSFFGNLCSLFDILGQIINISYDLGLKEDEVTFFVVFNKLKKYHSTDAVTIALMNLTKASYFKTARNFRHSSNHRRPSAVFHDTSSSGTSATYSTTTVPTETSVVYYLCNDPNAISPKKHGSRKIPEFLNSCKDRIEIYLSESIKHILN